MSSFSQYLVSGLATGSIYALVALGLALIYRSTRILNFAHGDITTAGTFCAFILLGLLTIPLAWTAHKLTHVHYDHPQELIPANAATIRNHLLTTLLLALGYLAQGILDRLL